MWDLIVSVPDHYLSFYSSILKNSGFYKHARINEIFEQILCILDCHRVTFQPIIYLNLTFC